jgi:alcohol dehydrogenase class IV
MESAGVRPEHVDTLAAQALEDYFITCAPAPWTLEEARAVYEQGLALGPAR